MSHLARYATLSVCIVVAAQAASAALIPGITASTDMGAANNTDIVNTVNGAGLSTLSLTATHASTIPSNSWISADRVLTGNVTFDLHGLYDLSGFSFWNQNAGGPLPDGGTGIDGVDVLVSVDGLSFVPWISTHFSQVTVPGPVGPEIFDPVDVLAGAVRFHILNAHRDVLNVGFAEVQFNGVPATNLAEPGTLALLCAALTGMFGVSAHRVQRKDAQQPQREPI